MLPLHILVLVAFNLVRSRTKGETLFGAIACLCCLLVHGANPDATAEVSVHLLLEEGDADAVCSHSLLSPSDLASELTRDERYTAALRSQGYERRRGWELFTAILEVR